MESLHRALRGLESADLNFFNNIAGNPSGPEAELVPSLSIAFSMSLYVNIMSVSRLYGLLNCMYNWEYFAYINTSISGQLKYNILPDLSWFEPDMC